MAGLSKLVPHQIGTVAQSTLAASAMDISTFGPEPHDLERLNGFSVGTLINSRYKVVEILGQGGMGVVHRVQDRLHPERDVALKTIRCDAAKLGQISLFRTEFRTMANLRHPNIATVLDFEQVEGTTDYFLTMDYVDGRDLVNGLHGEPLEVVLDHVVVLCRALSYVHSRGVVHLDLKPENVLVDGDGRLKVLDFGLAGISQLQQGALRGGTPNYMAPEMIDRRVVDHRADLYALGIIIYQLMCGKVPFTGSTPREVLEQHLSDPIWFDEAVQIAPEWLRELVVRLCAKNASERFQTANAVIEAINRGSGRSYDVETSDTRESYVLSARFVGRKSEMRALQDFIDKRTHHSVGCKAAILISGAAGIGKTRLLEETRRSAQLDGKVFIDAYCHRGDYGSYGAWVDVVRSAVVLANAIDRSELLMRCGAQLVKIDPTLEGEISYTPQNPLQDERAEQVRMMEQVTEFLCGLADTHPFTLCFHDLHWARRGTTDLMAYLIRRVALQDSTGHFCGLSLLVASRDDEDSPHGAGAFAEVLDSGHVDRMVLGPLHGPEIADVVSSMFGLAELPEVFMQRVIREAAGNPFFVQEVMRALVDNGSVRVHEGRWDAADDIGEFEVPGSIREVFLERVALLGDPTRWLLDHLALLARPTEADVLKSALGLSDEGFHSMLSELLQRQLILPAAGDASFQLAHDRMRETLYDEMSIEARRRGHRAVAAAIERIYGRAPGAHLLDLAEHHWGGETGEAALESAVEGGEYALKTNALDDAILMFDRALQLLPRFPGHRVSQQELLEKLGDVYASTGRDYGLAVEKYQAVLKSADDSLTVGRIHRKIGSVHLATGALMEANLKLWQAVDLLKGDAQGKLYRIGETAMVLVTAYAPTFVFGPMVKAAIALAKPYGNPATLDSASVEERRELSKVYAAISQLAGFT